MTQQEINETAKQMEEGEMSLVDWTDNRLKELARKLGLELVMIDHPNQNKQEDTPITGTITFLKGESAEKAAKYFQKKKDY